jgi:CopG family transcriptional regulator, nickel-responsive regulator
LTQQAWISDTEDAAGTITLVYDHHKTHLAERLLELQHRRAGLVVSTMHIHLDHDNCVEVIVLRGPAADLQMMARELSGLKGIRKGEFVLASAKESR